MAAAAPSPPFRTVTDSVNTAPVTGLSSLTEGEPTTKSEPVVVVVGSTTVSGRSADLTCA